MTNDQSLHDKQVSKTNDRYCVFGNPITHSKSPLLHSEFAKQTNQLLSYSAQCIDKNDFKKAAHHFFTSGGKGLNITVPFKHDAFDFADSLSIRAMRAGAVNTLSVNDANDIVGDNTDGIGLVSDITQYLGWTIKNKNILIIGAGGAVRGILDPFIQESPKSISIVNRTKEKAEELSNDFSDIFSISAFSYPELDKKSITPFDIIINGSSASLAGELPPLPSSIVSGDTCCYDMMYAKEFTPFLLWAKDNGAQYISDGLGMLVCQGAESFYIWRGVKPKTDVVIKLIREQL